MCRLPVQPARLALAIGYVVLAPAVAIMAQRLVMSTGAPGIDLTLALALTYVLVAGRRAGPVVVIGFLADGLVVHGAAVAPWLVLIAVGQAAAVSLGAWVLEVRAARRGRIRSPAAVIEFFAVSAVVLPLAAAALERLPAAVVDGFVATGPFVQLALADGLGVIALVMGLRLLLEGERFEVDRSTRVGIAAAALATAAMVLVTVRVSGVEALASAQVVLLPLLVIALLVGTAGYAISVAVATVLIGAPLAVLADVSAWTLGPAHQVAWWVAGFAGYLLATEGDRRRAAAVEFGAFFMRSATPTLSVSTGDGRVVLANRAVADLLGEPVGSLVGRPLGDLELGADDLEQALSDLLEDPDRDEVDHEVRVTSAAGGEHWVRCVAARIDLGGPQHDVVQVQFVDLTAEHAREEVLRRSNEALARFGRRVTHDLKQPVAAVASYASTLLEHADQMDESIIQTMHERLAAVAQRAVAQLDETFAAAGTSAGGVVPCNLHQVIAAVVGILSIDLAEVDGAVETALAVERVRAEPAMLRQVLLNIMTNSLKYARDDTPPRIRVAARARAGGVELTVTDNGTGIAADELEHVFDRGSRLDPARAEGRGHGLADSRELVEAAGGRLSAEPWPDGARFVLWLPDPTAPVAAAVVRTLLVDDAPDELARLQRHLGEGSSVDVVGTATTLDDAIEATQDLRPDVVLLDRWLEGEDGLTAVPDLARAHPDVRIILLTPHPSPEDDQRARAVGVLRAIDKTAAVEDVASELEGREH